MGTHLFESPCNIFGVDLCMVMFMGMLLKSHMQSEKKTPLLCMLYTVGICLP